MTSITHDPSQRRLRVQLTALYAGVIILLVAVVLAVSGLLERQGSTNINGGSSSDNAVFGHHLDVGPLIVGVIAGIVAVGLAWWMAGRYLRSSAPPAKTAD